MTTWRDRNNLMNQNSYLGGGTNAKNLSMLSGNKKMGQITNLRGASRPGTPALSEQTISTYTNSQPRASSKRSTSGGTMVAGSKHRRRSVRGGDKSNPYGSASDGLRQGSMRLRNRKLGNRKLGRDPLAGVPTVPHILGGKSKVGSIGDSAEVSNKSILKSKQLGSRNSSHNGQSSTQYKKTAKKRRKSRPASADSWNQSGSPKSKGNTSSTSSSGNNKYGSVQSAYSQQNLRPNSASAASTISKSKKKKMNTGNINNNSSTTAGTIAGFIHRFRHGGPSTPEDRNNSGNGNHVWWKRQGTNGTNKGVGASHEFSPSTPERTHKGVQKKKINLKKKSKLNRFKKKDTTIPSNITANANNSSSASASEKGSPTARGSGMDAVAALRRSSSTSDVEDDLDRRATELLQRCDAMLTSSPPSASVAPRDVTNTMGSKEKYSPPPTSPSSQNTLSSVEKRSQQVLANADRLLHGAKLNPAAHPTGNTPPKPHSKPTHHQSSLLDHYILKSVQNCLFAREIPTKQWSCNQFGHLFSSLREQEIALTALERLEKNLMLCC